MKKQLHDIMNSLGTIVSELKCNLNLSEYKKCFYRRSAFEIWLRKKKIIYCDSIKVTSFNDELQLTQCYSRSTPI